MCTRSQMVICYLKNGLFAKFIAPMTAEFYMPNPRLLYFSYFRHRFLHKFYISTDSHSTITSDTGSSIFLLSHFHSDSFIAFRDSECIQNCLLVIFNYFYSTGCVTDILQSSVQYLFALFVSYFTEK